MSEAGFQGIKLKHGTLEKDVEIIEAVREAVGDDIRLAWFNPRFQTSVWFPVIRLLGGIEARSQ